LVVTESRIGAGNLLKKDASGTNKKRSEREAGSFVFSTCRAETGQTDCPAIHVSRQESYQASLQEKPGNGPGRRTETGKRKGVTVSRTKRTEKETAAE